MSDEDLKAELERLRSENAALKKGQGGATRIKVREKGGVSVYGASKNGVAALTRSMAIEWGKFNILANCIAPGHILTPLTVPTWEHQERSAYLRERITLGRPGLPEELVGLTILLASEASGYMTGQLYNLDGGALAGGQPWPFDTKY